jgi:hypothetical protein
MHRFAVIALLAVAGCAAQTSGQRSDPIPYALDKNGVQLVGQPERIDFGRAEASAIESMSKLEGGPPSATGRCALGLRFADWPSGVSLLFENGAFVGWKRDPVAGSEDCQADGRN